MHANKSNHLISSILSVCEEHAQFLHGFGQRKPVNLEPLKQDALWLRYASDLELALLGQC
jgi:hypothetical protein